MLINSLKFTPLFSIVLGSTSLSATCGEEPLKELQVSEPSITTTLSYSGGMASGKPAQSLSSLSMISKKEKAPKQKEDIFALFDRVGRTKQIDLANQLFIIATKDPDPKERQKAQDRLDKSVIPEIRKIGVRAKELNNKNELNSSSSSQNVTPLSVSQKNAASGPSNLKPSLQSSSNSPVLTTSNTLISAKNKKVTNGPNVGTAQTSINSASQSVTSKKLLQKLGIKESPETTRILEQYCFGHLTDGQIKRLFGFILQNPMQLKKPTLIIPILTKIQIKQWENFCKCGVSLITKEMNDQQKVEILEAVAESKTHTSEFINVATSLTEDLNHGDKVNVIKAFVGIEPKNHTKVKEIATSLTKDISSQRSAVIETLAKIGPENYTDFKDVAISLTKNVEFRDSIIEALTKIGPENYTDFKDAAISLTKNITYGLDRASIINSFAKIGPKNYTAFKDTVISLTTNFMDGLDRASISTTRAKIRLKDYIVFISNSLAGVKPENLTPNFRQAAISLISNNTDHHDNARVITALAKVMPEKQEFVYTNIQTLMNRIQVKFTRGEHVRQLVEALAGFDQQTAETFVARVIHLVETDTTANVRVDEQRLLTHLETTRTRLTRTTRDEARVLLTHRQSTHKKEAHESIAMSLEKLKRRYPDAFRVGNIFEMVKAKLKSLSHDNTEDLFKRAVSELKKTYSNLNIDAEIDKLLIINPYTRAGANDEDTLLNQCMRAFLQSFQENQEFRKDVISLVGTYSRMKDYDNALMVISFMENESGYKDQTSGMSYVQKLSLICAAINDRKSQKSGDELTDQDIEGRWRVLFTRYASAYNEYGGNSSSCTGGIFNAGVEALDGVHPDVNIIRSFRALMQEISLEKDDNKYEERVKIALLHLGEKAQNDPYYQDEIESWRDARKELKDPDENKEEPYKLCLPSSSSSREEEE